MSDLRRHFGTRLQRIRKQRGLTQDQFAELVDISIDFLSLIERGRSAPSFETLERIGKKLKMPVSELFTFEPPLKK